MCDITDARMKAIQGYLKEILEEIKATNGYLRAMCGADTIDTVKMRAVIEAFEGMVKEIRHGDPTGPEEPKRL